MRLRGVYLLLATAASVGAMLVLAGPAAAANLYCGETLTSSVTLIGNLDCSGTPGSAIIIGHDGVLLNLNGFAITGYSGAHVIQNWTGGAPGTRTYYNGTTIKNGTLNVTGDGWGVDNYAGTSPDVAGNNLTLDVVNIAGDGTLGSEGVWTWAEYGGGVGTTVVDSTISGVDYGIDLDYATGYLIKNNTITATASGDNCIEDSYATGGVIMGNNLTTDTPGTGTGYRPDDTAGTVFSGNTLSDLEYGIHAEDYTAGLMITGNVFGGAAPADGLGTGIYFPGDDEYSHGDVISGNFIRNSFDYAVEDRDSFNNTYVGNIATANGRATDDYTYYMKVDGYGPLTMVNNIARIGYSVGFYINEAYSGDVSGPPYSVFSGNSSIANGTDGSPGFYDFNSVGSTWTSNVAKYNASDGFFFDEPWREIVTGNTSSLNGNNGFTFNDVYEDTQPLAVTNNSATYNGGFGFSGWDSMGYSSGDSYPVAGSGNTGGGTNGAGDCYLVAGCS